MSDVVQTETYAQFGADGGRKQLLYADADEPVERGVSGPLERLVTGKL